MTDLSSHANDNLFKWTWNEGRKLVFKFIFACRKDADKRRIGGCKMKITKEAVGEYSVTGLSFTPKEVIMSENELKYPMKDWKWRGVPGHFICARDCVFRLHTTVGPYKISTVGAMYRHGEMEEIGLNRHYETYVFVGDSLSEIDGGGIHLKKDAKNDPKKADELAEQMHVEFCLKYATGNYHE